MLTYYEAEKLFLKARYPERGKRIDNNTYLLKRDDHYAVRLHQTDVVKIYPNGTWKLNSGGWDTVTTKDRINKFSPARLFQLKRELYLQTKLGPAKFVDGMVIDDKGYVVEKFEWAKQLPMRYQVLV